MIIAKIHTRNETSILALCDPEILGKKFEEGDLQLDLTSNFYKGEEIDENEIHFEKYEIINAVGEKSVNLLLKNKLIDQDKIIKIAGIPHAQCVVMRGS